MTPEAAAGLRSLIQKALDTVIDPEIRRPITELGMVEALEVDDQGRVRMTVLLTVAGCPMRETIEADIAKAVGNLPGVTELQVTLAVMSPQQRAELTASLRGGSAERSNPFTAPGNLTRIVAVASGKGGVGKSSMTVNLAVALARAGQQVGLLDADIYGHSIPDMLGIGEARPTVVDQMIMPVTAHGVKVISMGMLKESRDQVIAWRGPMLGKALNQFLNDVYWGDLDILLIDLPPGTGDVAMSIGQELPGSEVLVVTTPQSAAAEVAERAGTMAALMKQTVLGVVENMSWLEVACPHCGQVTRVEVFGSGGGAAVAAELSIRIGRPVPLLGQIPLDPQVRAGGDQGTPVVLTDPDSPTAKALVELAEALLGPRGLAGRSLGVHPVAH